MKKNSLKTILEDFFSWKHVLIWVIVLLLTGVGVAWAITNQGYRLNHQVFIATYPLKIDLSFDSSYTHNCELLQNETGSGSFPAIDYFVPAGNNNDWNAFLANMPANVTATPCSCPAGYYSDGPNCLVCGTCNFYCIGNKHRYLVPAGYYSIGGPTYDCTKRTGILECPAGQYCIDGVRYHCPLYTTSPVGSTKPSDCTPATTCVPDGSCATKQCGVNNCGTSCGAACDPNIEFCNSQGFCQPLCSGNPQSICEYPSLK